MSPLAGRIARAWLLVPLVAIASYFLMALLPLQLQTEGRTRVSSQLEQSYRHDLGLGEPFGFLRPWQKLVRGERLGTAARGVTGEELLEKLGGSLTIGGAALVLALLGAVLYAAARQVLARVGLSLLSNLLFGIALGTPAFLFALLLAPAVVERSVFAEGAAAAVVIALWPAVFLGRFLADALARELGKDYVRAARAKGLTRRAAFLRHVVPNLVPSLLDVLPPVATAILGGSFAAERVLGLPFFGELYVVAVLQRQIAVVVVATTLFSAILAVVTLLVELARWGVDPRVRHPEAAP